MKTLLTLAFTLITIGLHAADAPKSFPASLTKCLVSGDKLGGDMGKPYVFTHEGQEVKLCCKSCLKDFNKEPAKYMKQIAEAAAAKK
jgi:hypothetical protein